MNRPLLHVEHLSKAFTPGVFLWQDLNFDLNMGQSLSICGESGSGKSTLLFALGGLEPVQQGQILFQGHPVVYTKNQAYIPGISYIFQHYHLIEELDVKENILWPTRIIPPKEMLFKTIIEGLGLEPLLHRMPGALSGGERQRVAIARALVTQPTLLLADEPTGSLDMGTGSKVMDLLFYICKTLNTSFILVTHNLEFAQRTDQQFYLKGGQQIHEEN